MTESTLRVGIMGAGSIGCYIGGRLLVAGAADVVLVGRERVRDEIIAHDLTVVDMGSDGQVVAGDAVTYVTDPAKLADCDVVLLCVKSAQTRDTARELATVLRDDAIVISLQNGVRNSETLRAELSGRLVIAGIVTFNVVSQGTGVFFRGTTGPIMLEASTEPRAAAIAEALRASGIDVEVQKHLAPHQWTKLLVNLNNAVSALSGAPTAEILQSPSYRKVVAAVVGEAIGVMRAAKIKPAKLRGVPVGIMPSVLRMPTPIVKLVTRRQMKVDPEARSSMWEDLKKGRLTEVEYLNGEIVTLAEKSGVEAPLNRRIVELVHQAEKAGQGSPGLDAAALWSAISSAPS